MKHSLTIEKTSYGHWAECSCRWSTGPTTKAQVTKDHAAHVAQKRNERTDLDLWDEVEI